MADRIWLMLNDRVIDGIPEQVASDGYFESLFSNNPHLYFDPEKCDFRVRKESKGRIRLTATGNELPWAMKALERLGFDVITKDDTSGIPEIQVHQLDQGWSLSYSAKRIEIGSLGELCREVKNIRLQP